MKPNRINFWLLVSAAVFFFVGLVFVVKPQEMQVFHPAKSEGYLEHISKSGSRAYGCLGMAFGVGIAWFVLYPGKK